MVTRSNKVDNYKCIVNILIVSYTLFYIRFFNFANTESIYVLQILSFFIIILESLFKVGLFFNPSLCGPIVDGLQTNFVIGIDNEDKPNSRVRKSKIKITGILCAILCSIFSIILTHITIIIFGAYVTKNFEETLTLSCIVASLVFIRPILRFGSSALLNISQDWNWSNCSQVQGSFVLLGTWLGAFLIPLDWNRPWQVWPLPCCIGALFGDLTASVILLYDRSRKLKKAI